MYTNIFEVPPKIPNILQNIEGVSVQKLAVLQEYPRLSVFIYKIIGQYKKKEEKCFRSCLRYKLAHFSSLQINCLANSSAGILK
jgi:hypothetical protein